MKTICRLFTVILLLAYRSSVTFSLGQALLARVSIDRLSSTGLISCHFAGKDELIERVVVRKGLESSEFREFDARVMAAGVLRSVDGLLVLLESHPNLDQDHYAWEMLVLFELDARRSG